MKVTFAKVRGWFNKVIKGAIDSLVWILLVAYLMVSVSYQASSFWLNDTLFSEVENISGDCFELRLRLPDQIPLSTPKDDRNGKPVTIWGWKTLGSNCTDQELVVNLSDKGKLVFTDAKKIEIASSFLVKLGGNEADSPRYTTFVFSPLMREEINSVKITVNAIDKNNTLYADSYFRSVQSPKTYGFFQVLDICLGTTVFSIIAFVFSAIKYAIDQGEKTKGENEAFKKKLELLAKQKIELALTVNRLFEEARRLRRTNEIQDRFEQLKKDLDHGSIWSLSLRKEIASNLGKADFETYLSKISENLNYPSSAEGNDLIAFSNLIKGDIKQDQFTQDKLDLSFRVFQTLGFSSKEALINYLKRQKDKIQAADWLHEWYDEKGRAAGRYLLRQIDDPNLQSRLDNWDHANPSPPNRISSPYWLWPQKMPFVASGDNAKELPEPKDWWHPFGPIKAEDDPRLPRSESNEDNRPVKALFWENKPIWDKVSSAESACFYMSPGMGMSALILMGRHERRFWGTKPSLSLYISLHGKPDSESINKSLEKALGEAVLLGTVEDPFWILNAPESIQEQVGAFLLYWAGNDFARLLRRLAEAGLPEGEQLLVADMLYKTCQSQLYRSSSLKDLIHIVVVQMGRAAFIRTLDAGPFKMYIWIELRDDTHAREWLNMFAAEGLAGTGVLKVFIRKLVVGNGKCGMDDKKDISANKISADATFIDEWTKQELTKLFEHRANQAKLQKDKLGFLIRDLIQDAQGSPQRLIQIGNEKFFRQRQG